LLELHVENAGDHLELGKLPPVLALASISSQGLCSGTASDQRIQQGRRKTVLQRVARLPRDDNRKDAIAPPHGCERLDLRVDIPRAGGSRAAYDDHRFRDVESFPDLRSQIGGRPELVPVAKYPSEAIAAGASAFGKALGEGVRNLIAFQRLV